MQYSPHAMSAINLDIELFVGAYLPIELLNVWLLYLFLIL
ncbi:hypothetical protein JCM19232_6079 [Vibrio ishigakensis]|uniref:Uncharacterized protein n=1 Tax=Vibrio ishigakensis TaxID=1481914 RepID=A0A0B8PG19_9VIBR|nr:hypothetical protein JCM19232_6079 [Vibrio ishigakensis]